MKNERYLWLAGVLFLAVSISLLGVLRSTLGRTDVAAANRGKGPSPVAALDTSTRLPVKGTQSCSNRGCHGAIEPALDGREKDKVWQNEYAQWAFDERHANAYQTLLGEKSQKIARLLGGNLPAHDNPSCLACHANPYIAELKDSHFAQDEKVFGVGCESCHGSANKWLVAHTKKEWRGKSPEEKASEYGMVPVEHAGKRAEACAGCHVGGPKANGLPVRDMNHDMIAAGHPRLNFEMSAFQANMPPHWRPYDQRGAKQKETTKGKMWVAGQIASAQAALDLLIHRAGQPATWPEFAEYDCYACHHSFAEPSWRVTADRGNRKPGEVPWGSWYFALPLSDDPAVDDLAKFMRISNAKPRIPDAAKAKNMAINARTALQKLAEDLEKNEDDELASKRIWELIDAKKPRLVESWDSAEQLYLALHAVSAVNDSPAFQALARDRSFRTGFNSPVSVPKKGEKSVSPHDFFEKLKALPR